MPFVSVDIDMCEFDSSELIEELETRGYTCSKSGGRGGIDLERIEHLAVCGQKDAARAELMAMAGASIGLNLTH